MGLGPQLQHLRPEAGGGIYQKDHPNFKLNIEENVYSDIETKLITAATSEDYSTLPDLFLMQDYSYHKMVANFPGIYTELDNGGFNWDDFSGGKLADSTVDGHHYGIPFDNGASIMPSVPTWSRRPA